MASLAAAIRRSAALSLRLRRLLEQQLHPLERRFMSSSVPTERYKCPSSDPRSSGSMEQKSHINEKKEDIYQRISTTIDKLSDGIDEHSRLLKQLEAQIEENNKHRGAIDLTPWVVSIPASFLLVALYHYIQG